MTSEEEARARVVESVVGYAEACGYEEMAHTVGPFIDPTLYRDQLQRGDMDALAAVCRSLREPIRVWDEKMAPRIPA